MKHRTRIPGLLILAVSGIQDFWQACFLLTCFSLSLVGFSTVAATVTPTPAAGAREVRYKETSLEFKPGDHLLVSGIRGQVRLSQLAPGENAPTNLILRARKLIVDRAYPQANERFEAASLGLRRESHTLIIEEKGPQNKNDWVEWTKPAGAYSTSTQNLNGPASAPAALAASAFQKAVPEMIFEIIAPQGMTVPVEVVMHDGSIVVQGWKASVSMSLVQGSVHTTGTDGDLKIQVQNGDIKVADHRGPLEVDSYSARLLADNIDGDLRLDNFAGESVLKDVKGSLQLKTYSGPTAVAQASGALDFELGRGNLKIDGFDGALRGQTENASVLAQIAGEADVNIQSDQGAVNVRLPNASGALVRLQSESGVLMAPESIRQGATPSSRTATGRLVGNGPRGLVAIRSKTASIRVRGPSGTVEERTPANVDERGGVSSMDGGVGDQEERPTERQRESPPAGFETND